MIEWDESELLRAALESLSMAGVSPKTSATSSSATTSPFARLNVPTPSNHVRVPTVNPRAPRQGKLQSILSFRTWLTSVRGRMIALTSMCFIFVLLILLVRIDFATLGETMAPMLGLLQSIDTKLGRLVSLHSATHSSRRTAADAMELLETGASMELHQDMVCFATIPSLHSVMRLECNNMSPFFHVREYLRSLQRVTFFFCFALSGVE